MISKINHITFKRTIESWCSGGITNNAFTDICNIWFAYLKNLDVRAKKEGQKKKYRAVQNKEWFIRLETITILIWCLKSDSALIFFYFVTSTFVNFSFKRDRRL